MRKKALAETFIITFSCLVFTGCSLSPDGETEAVHSIAEPYEFDLPGWEFDTLRHELWESLKPASGSEIDDTEIVQEYFASFREGGGPVREDLEDEAERIISRQIKAVLLEEDIANPLDPYLPLRLVFPPLDFEFELLPGLLVVSPRDEIRSVRRITLEPGLTVLQKEAIEEQVDALGYSSLVVNLGGVGFTYPAMVYETPDIRRAIDIAVEEWFHQYLVFRPLGFLYALDSLGWRGDYDIVTMNETAAGIVSGEIGALVYERYYAVAGGEEAPVPEGPSAFDLEMREIRIRVDEYLAQGEIEEAEEYMRQRRDFLAAKGYHIRKLNQAYFAFHGTYADDPSAVSPIGQDLQRLRSECSSLREFLDKVTGMTGYADLQKELGVTDR